MRDGPWDHGSHGDNGRDGDSLEPSPLASRSSFSLSREEGIDSGNYDGDHRLRRRVHEGTPGSNEGDEAIRERDEAMRESGAGQAIVSNPKEATQP